MMNLILVIAVMKSEYHKAHDVRMLQLALELLEKAHLPEGGAGDPTTAPRLILDLLHGHDLSGPFVYG